MGRMSRAGLSVSMEALVLSIVVLAGAAIMASVLLARSAPYTRNPSAHVVAELVPWTQGNGAIVKLTIANTGDVPFTIMQVKLYGPGCTGAGACRYTSSELSSRFGMRTSLGPGETTSGQSFEPNIRKLEDYVVEATFTTSLGETITASSRVRWSAG
ncbi:MAG: hypothetical protein QXP81_08500 [Nitrososphaerota archaeon]